MHAACHCTEETGHRQGDRLIEHIRFTGGKPLGKLLVADIAHKSRKKRKYKEMHRNLQSKAVCTGTATQRKMYFKAILKYICRKVNGGNKNNKEEQIGCL